MHNPGAGKALNHLIALHQEILPGITGVVVKEEIVFSK